MMSVVDKVKAAKSPSAALLVLAEEVDKIAARLDEAPAPDPWDTWEEEPETNEQAAAKVDEIERDIRLLQGAIAAENNPHEKEAMQAALRLKQDELKGPTPVLNDEGDRTEIELGEGEAVVKLREPTEKEKELRAKVAESLELDTNFGEGASEHFVKGGPLWLYYGNRDFVMGLPDDVKRAFVKEVLEHSPAEAHEMGRDILKDATIGDGPEATLERIYG